MESDIRAIADKSRELTFCFPYGLLTPGTVFAHARLPATRQKLLAGFKDVDLDDLDANCIDRVRMGCEKFGPAWDFLDNVTVAHAFADLAKPQRVLEIGVRRGRATAAVSIGNPDAELFLIDMWIPNYGMRDNPGPDLIRKQLAATGHRGEVHFHTGDSHEVLPKLFKSLPDMEFDLIIVDGDHSESGALQDLHDVFPKLAPGGALIFDDVAHPFHSYLLQLWRKCMEQLGYGVRSAEYLDQGHGVAMAIRSTPLG